MTSLLGEALLTEYAGSIDHVVAKGPAWLAIAAHTQTSSVGDTADSQRSSMARRGW